MTHGHKFVQKTIDMRKKRKFHYGEVNHIYQKSSEGFNLFYDDDDRLAFYTIFGVCMRNAPEVTALGLCLMYDHFHALLICDNARELAAFMNHLTSWFAKEFNYSTGRSGRLFRKNFGSAPKTGSKKVRTAIAYLFNNPVEKLLCERAEEYRWNFLKYHKEAHPFSRPLVRPDASSAMRKAIRIIDEMSELNLPLKHRLLKQLRKGLSVIENEQLTDYVIKSYFSFNFDQTISYYGSYETMMTAIDSNTGSEYDIKEEYSPSSDLAYDEIISYLHERCPETDLRKLIMASIEEKSRLYDELKAHTSATYRQICKFLHIKDLHRNPLSVSSLRKVPAGEREQGEGVRH